LLRTQKSSTLSLGYLIQFKNFQLFTYYIISNTRSKECIQKQILKFSFLL
jgi:hypothetical protein